MFKRISTFFLALVMTVSIIGCKTGSKLPEYNAGSFEISGFWAPYEISEESFKLYKDAGFTTLAMINHSLKRISENQFYLGSERTQKALEVCKKVGLKAILNYNDRVAMSSEGNKNYYSDTPFSQYDFYDDYKDIITGIHICDEPNNESVERYANKTFIEDFKKTYPNADYIINLVSKYAGATSYGYTTYDELVDDYADSIMTQFENPYISVDYYPFPSEDNREYPRREDMLITYNTIANTAKKYNAKKTMILQSSVSNEFASELTEGDMRFQVNMALAFGADNLQYYCYSVRKTFDENGTATDYMHDYCILKQDDTPSDLYYYLKDIHKEIQSYSDVILSYDWQDVTVVNAIGFGTNKDVSAMMMKDDVVFENSERYEKAVASTDLVISRFESEKYGEAFMLVNYAQKGEDNNVATITFKNCEEIAVYGGNGFDGTPKIVQLDEENKYRTELEYGEGIFIVPLK